MIMPDLPRVEKVPSVATVMTPFPCTVGLDATVEKVASLMQEYEISHVPVEHDHHLAGLVDERDVATSSPDTRVEELSSREAYAVDLHESLGVVAREMVQRNVEAAVVLREGKLAGIFTLTDACDVLARILGEYDSPRDDDSAA